MIKKGNLLFFCMAFSTLSGQDQTVGWFGLEPGAAGGYTLFQPIRSTTTYLIDNCGREVHRWESDFTPGNSVYLLENGRLLRTAKSVPDTLAFFQMGGAGERVQLVDWDGAVLWDFRYADDRVRMHHDIEPLPNGNVLILAWERKTEEEAIAAGRDPGLLPDGELWSEHIIEVLPFSGEIVWEWHLWDHLVQDFDQGKDNFGAVAAHPELLDVNITGGASADGSADWTHANSIAYNPERDEIMILSPFLDELYVIDHSTTTAEAAGHRGGKWDRGGDFLFRWGNPRAYGQGTAADRQFFGAHDAHWIPQGLPGAGNIMVFNNGDAERPYSSVDILEPPVDDYLNGSYVYVPGNPFLPQRPAYRYGADPPGSFFSSFISGAQRLPNGNTLICAGAQGRFFEITPSEEAVWEYVNPVTHLGPVGYTEEIPIFSGRNGNIVFRCTKYGPDYPGFQDRDLTAGDPLELNFPEPYPCEMLTDLERVTPGEVNVFPVPARDRLTIALPDARQRRVCIFDALGRLIWEGQAQSELVELAVGQWPAGTYRLLVENETSQEGWAMGATFVLVP